MRRGNWKFWQGKFWRREIWRVGSKLGKGGKSKDRAGSISGERIEGIGRGTMALGKQ